LLSEPGVGHIISEKGSHFLTMTPMHMAIAMESPHEQTLLSEAASKSVVIKQNEDENFMCQ
jgi:hypothetical protein